MEKGNLELDLDGPAIHLSLSYDNGSNIFLHMIASNTELTKVCAGMDASTSISSQSVL